MSLLLLLVFLAASPDEPAAVVETRTWRQSIPLDGLHGLTVHNLHGGIAVTGDGGDGIRMVVSERIEAADRAELERARAEVSLKITRRGERVLVCADGPFREPDDCTEWKQGFHPRSDYRVVYELEIRVPRSLDLTIVTIEGDLSVSDVRGRLDVRGVQGAVDILGAAGAVRAGTVNSSVRVRFAQNPPADSSFSTINGEIDVDFQPGLSADLSFETMNGEVLTDFEHTRLSPVVQRSESRRQAGTTWRLEIVPAIRIGRGGPRHHFENINGDITIRRYGRS
ncbi:MAG TPA: hypothetical protein VJV23_02510 [Candidatus Polarisedimenticolia bacterium]|nr:hypothetical protein [Candidatus Polarisedimenticolia bacterium]